jgi:uncharacterized membrane protein
MLAVLVRHYFNTRHDSSKYVWTLPAAALGMICLAFVTGPQMKSIATDAPQAAVIKYATVPATGVSGTPQAAKPVEPAEATPAEPSAAAVAATGEGDFTQVNSVIKERCSVCHSATPSSPMFSAPPAGFILDTPEQIKAQAAKIHAQSVASQIMPLGNITQMTQDERDLIGAWIDQGAQLN